MLRFGPWKITLVALVCAAGLLFAAPNLFSRATLERLPDWVPADQINLGLDLQGGSYLLLQVQTDVVLGELLEAVVDNIREQLRERQIRYRNLGVDGRAATVTIIDEARLDESEEALREIDPDMTLETDPGGRLRLVFTDQALRERNASVVSQSLEVIRKRIDETGVREPTIQRQGADRILVQVPGVDDPERLKELIESEAKMNFHLVADTPEAFSPLETRAPPGTMRLPLRGEVDQFGNQRQILVRKRVIVSGENLVDAQATFQDGQPVVSFRFDSIGGRKFGEATSNNVGSSLAIVLDDEVISAPRIREPILGGSGVITGNFTVPEAQDLALLLRAGALPAPLTIIEERTVGPGLGADSIAAGKVASIVGIVAVAVFMVITYALFGVFAVIALLMNMVLIAALLSLVGATLTLPGIAGIVLTVGMAVDANVLIFEHIREETQGGRAVVHAVDAGFSRAITTILDSNITTLIAAILLYIFGSGPVRGFAVTLAFGLVSSMFTAIMLTRLLIALWLRRTRPKALPV